MNQEHHANPHTRIPSSTLHNPCIHDNTCSVPYAKTEEYSSIRLDHLLIGVTGAIGAAFLPNAILWLRKNLRSTKLTIILSGPGSCMVSPTALQALSGGRVLTDTDFREHAAEPLHVTLTMGADIFLIMPATANIIGKSANGIADDLISSSIIGANCPVVFCPSMKSEMWRRPVVQRNVDSLRRDGHWVIDPVEGYSIASGKMETGGMPSFVDVFAQICAIIATNNKCSADEIVSSMQSSELDTKPERVKP